MKVTVKGTGCVDYQEKLYFAGDEIDLPDKDAKHLLEKGICEPSQPDVTTAELKEIVYGIPAGSFSCADMTVPDLKKLLGKLVIPYDARAKRDDLIALVEANATLTIDGCEPDNNK